VRTPASLLLPALVLLLSVATACRDGGPSGPTSDVVSTIPWQASESLTYALKDRGGKSLGQGRLSVAVSGSETVLSQLYQSDTSSDQIQVRVDSRTLKPISSTRQIKTARDEETVEVTYTEEGALIRQGDKQSGLGVPEHAYDNDSSLFLWRTIDFAAVLDVGFPLRYVTIVTNRRSRQTVELRVVGRETVRVPAGELSAWRLEIRTSNANQTAWYASDLPTRPLLRYDNDRGTIFELQKLP